ncbi:hypothetical protein ADUPG1_005575, partial [Aduncisulcus paluster]
DRILYEEHVRLGHASATSLMISLQKEGVRFAGMERLAKELISSCVYCQKLSRKGYKRAFATIASRKAFEEVSIDTLGPIPEDVHGFKFLLVCIDAFTRFTEIIPIISTSGEEAAMALLTHVIGRYGIPKKIRSDGGPQFKN